VSIALGCGACGLILLGCGFYALSGHPAACLRRTIGIVILALMAMGAFLIALENVRGRRAVRDYKARLVIQGEKLTIDELTPVFSISARRAADDLIQSAWQLVSNRIVQRRLVQWSALISMWWLQLWSRP
jgi:hypothetical protein